LLFSQAAAEAGVVPTAISAEEIKPTDKIAATRLFVRPVLTFILNSLLDPEFLLQRVVE
jgi:hypothetical protein